MTRTAVTYTSIEAYDAIKADGTLSRQQAVIVGVMARGRDYSLQELVNLTGLPVNVISGRANEMKASRVLEPAPKRACTVTGRTINPVRLPAPPGAQGVLFS